MFSKVHEIMSELLATANVKPISTPSVFKELESDLINRLVPVVEDDHYLLTRIDMSNVKATLKDFGKFEIEDVALEIMPKANVSNVPIECVNRGLVANLALANYEFVGMEGFRKPFDGRYHIPINMMKNREMTASGSVIIRKDKKYKCLEVGQLVYNAFNGELTCPKVGGYSAPVLRVFYSERNDAEKIIPIMYSTLRDRKFSMNYENSKEDSVMPMSSLQP